MKLILEADSCPSITQKQIVRGGEVSFEEIKSTKHSLTVNREVLKEMKDNNPEELKELLFNHFTKFN